MEFDRLVQEILTEKAGSRCTKVTGQQCSTAKPGTARYYSCKNW